MKTNPTWYFTEKQIGVDYLDSKIAGDYDKEHQSFRDFNAEAEDIVEKLKITREIWCLILDVEPVQSL